MTDSPEAAPPPAENAASPSLLSKLVSENELLKVERENAALRLEIASLGAPWWRKASTVTLLTTILAAVIPATTAVQGYFQKERELALEEAKQAHAIAMEKERQTEQIRTGYLDRIKDQSVMVRTLRFVEATSQDPSLRAWAKEEIRLLGDEVGREKQRLIDLESAAAAAKKAYLDALGLPESERPGASTLEALKERSADLAKQVAESKRSFDGFAQPCRCTPGDPLCTCD